MNIEKQKNIQPGEKLPKEELRIPYPCLNCGLLPVKLNLVNKYYRQCIFKNSYTIIPVEALSNDEK